MAPFLLKRLRTGFPPLHAISFLPEGNFLLADYPKNSDLRRTLALDAKFIVDTLAKIKNVEDRAREIKDDCFSGNRSAANADVCSRQIRKAAMRHLSPLYWSGRGWGESQVFLTSIFRGVCGCTAWRLGSVKVSTPFSNRDVTFSSSMPSGSRKDRSNEP